VQNPGRKHILATLSSENVSSDKTSGSFMCCDRVIVSTKFYVHKYVFTVAQIRLELHFLCNCPINKTLLANYKKIRKFSNNSDIPKQDNGQ